MNNKTKVLNLYAGIGGSVYLLDDSYDVTSVEICPLIGKVYQALCPGHKLIIGDAKSYLLNHADEYDIILCSPPCQSSSRLNYSLNAKGNKRYPDLSIYQLIIYLKQFFKGIWVVENVIGYYEPLIKPQIIGRHYIWANIVFRNIHVDLDYNINTSNISVLQNGLGINIDFAKGLGKRKDQALRNCLHPVIGLQIVEQMANVKKQKKFNQNKLF